MAGKVFFKNGKRHVSRLLHTTEFGAEFLESLVGILGKKITPRDWGYLAQAIAIAKADNDRQTRDRATRKDALAQLKAMRRLKDYDALLQALRGCDRMTLEAIRQAQTDAIGDVLGRDGVFVDADGVEHQSPPGIDHVGPMERVQPYLPMGFEGLRNAIADALKSIEADEVREESDPDLQIVMRRTRIHPKSTAGNLEKTYQIALATECIVLWKKYGNAKQRKPWCTASTGKRSDVVSFSCAVFMAAGMPLADGRLTDLLKKARRLRAQELSESGRRRMVKRNRPIK